LLRVEERRLWQDRCLINGEWRPALDGAVTVVANPADRQIIAKVPAMGARETAEAIAAAEAAWPKWRSLSGKDRARILHKWSDLILGHADDLALMMSAEQGKPRAEAHAEVLYAASFIEWFAEEAKRVCGDVMLHPQAGKRIVVTKQPVGVCAAITPWNFPAAMITRKAAPALAAGCVIIIKPAEQTPLTALALAELAQRAGVPAGVLQVITGDARTIGAVLTGSPVVRKLSFTGSTEVGRILMAQCAGTVKRVSLELGGNAPLIVFEDADLDKAVEGTLASKFRNAGQTCVCANRILVQDGIYDAFAKRLVDRVARLKVGAASEPDVAIGPLIDEAAIAKVEEHVADAVRKGGQIMVGGKRHERGGLFFEPTVVARAHPQMLIAREETFGPVAALFRFSSEQEAIALANDTEFGLAAYFFTRDVGRAWRVSEALECGMIGHNTGLISNEVAPFGGVKQSGIGREGSKYGIEEYLELKYLCMEVPEAA
jgi:succinate-semialdehyde dehydrogenase / glutarate-semialdehyde dehydrogenase